MIDIEDLSEETNINIDELRQKRAKNTISEIKTEIRILKNELSQWQKNLVLISGRIRMRKHRSKK